MQKLTPFEIQHTRRKTQEFFEKEQNEQVLENSM